MDADDYLQPTHLQNYAEAPAADIIYQGYRLFDEHTGATIEEYRMPAMEARTRSEAMEVLCKLWERKMFFGPTWNKIFRRSIISRWHIRFREDITLREDEIFTFEYCQYISSALVLPTMTYNYRRTAGSLMRSGYREPESRMKMINCSLEASLQLPLTPRFRTLLEQYYTDGCTSVGWSAYYPFKLKSLSERTRYIRIIQERNSLYPTSKSQRFCIGTERMTDCFQLLLYVCRTLRYVLKKSSQFKPIKSSR